MDEKLVAAFFEQGGFWFGVPPEGTVAKEFHPIGCTAMMIGWFPGFFGFRCYQVAPDDGGSQQFSVSFWV